MSDSPQLAAIRARVAMVANMSNAAHVDEASRDRRALLAMLDAAHRDLAACKIARDGFIHASDEACAENQRLRATLERIASRACHYKPRCDEIRLVFSNEPQRPTCSPCLARAALKNEALKGDAQ